MRQGCLAGVAPQATTTACMHSVLTGCQRECCNEKYESDLHHTLSHLRWQAWPVCCCFARIFAHAAVQ